MAEPDEESSVTLGEIIDYMDEEDQMTEDADAVLGGSDDRNCTYLMGYVGRQALYACKTCFDQSEGKEDAGVCLACSLECHDGHDLVELYTKRNFRCDCGNSKFPKDFNCKLCPKKMPVNESNSYNQNFKGLYCTCSKPYPDPNDTVEDVMIQCNICEDWFHGRHLTSMNVESFEYDDMICSSCMSRNSFLWSYVGVCKGIYEKSETANPSVGSEQDPSGNNSNSQSSSLSINSSSNEEPTDSKAVVDVTTLDDSEPKGSFPPCKLAGLTKDHNCSPANDSAVFFPSSWRKELCACSDCTKMYEDKSLAFLLCDGDSMEAYVEKGKANSTKALCSEEMSKMSHFQKVELIHGYNDLKSNLMEYLKKFEENGKVVKEEDIAEFFTELRARKRPRPDDTTQF